MSEIKDISKLVKESRENKGLSARQLAKLCDVSHTEINNIEKGIRVRPALLTLKGFEKYLDLDFKTIAKMVGYSDESIKYADEEIVVSYEMFSKRLEEFEHERKELLYEIDKKRHLGMDIKEYFDEIRKELNNFEESPELICKIENIDKLLSQLIDMKK